MVYVRFPRQEQEGAFPESKAATRSSSVSIYGVFFKPNTLSFFLGFAAFQILLLSVLTYAPTALQ